MTTLTLINCSNFTNLPAIYPDVDEVVIHDTMTIESITSLAINKHDIIILGTNIFNEQALSLTQKIRETYPVSALLILCQEKNKVLPENLHSELDDYLFSPFETCEINLRIKRFLRIFALQKAKASAIEDSTFATLGQLAAGVAQEMNNPLSFIASNLTSFAEYASILKLLSYYYHQYLDAVTKQDESQQAELLKNIHSIRLKHDVDYILSDIESLVADTQVGVNKVRDVIANLRRFARVDDASRQDININDEINAALSLLATELKYRYVIESNLEPLPEIYGYPRQLNELIINLLMHALTAVNDSSKLALHSFHDDTFIYIDINYGSTQATKQDTHFAFAQAIIDHHRGELLFSHEQCGLTIKLPITQEPERYL